MKKGLVMEGGAMRGMFTAGVIDVLMENNISFDGAVGVSAGAVFGCNYKSKQIGRVIRYNLKYCTNPEYCSMRSWLKTGNLYGAEFCYHKIPEELDVFDSQTYISEKMEFFVVCTDVMTGKAIYRKCETADENEIEWMRASASMPVVSKIVEIGERKLIDGAIADSVPLKFFENIGYNKNVVILTQPYDYKKKKVRFMTMVKIALRKYPEAIKAMSRRHLMYNETLAYIKEKESKGEVFVIRPPHKLGIGHVEHNPEKLLEVYNTGREEAQKCLEALKCFLEQ